MFNCKKTKHKWLRRNRKFSPTPVFDLMICAKKIATPDVRALLDDLISILSFLLRIIAESGALKPCSRRSNPSTARRC